MATNPIFLVNQHARRAWWDSQHAILAPWPAPEVPCRPATDAETPRWAAQIVAAARGAGWEVRTTYTRGTRPGRPPRVVDSLCVRMRHDHRRAIGCWVDGRFDTAVIWATDQPPRRINATQLLSEVNQ